MFRWLCQLLLCCSALNTALLPFPVSDISSMRLAAYGGQMASWERIGQERWRNCIPMECAVDNTYVDDILTAVETLREQNIPFVGSARFWLHLRVCTFTACEVFSFGIDEDRNVIMSVYDADRMDSIEQRLKGTYSLDSAGKSAFATLANLLDTLNSRARLVPNDPYQTFRV